MSSLRNIAGYVEYFTEAIATITRVDIEVIDADRIRVAGTGIYAFSVGESIMSSGAIYNYALTRHETIFIENPKEHYLCQECDQKHVCEERLTFCTPIVSYGKVIGLIGLVCFTDEDRDRICANRDVFTYFFRQLADCIARVAEHEDSTHKLRQNMDMLLKVTNSNTTCVLVLDANNRISFINDAARSELGIRPGEYFHTAEIMETGDRYSDMGEFEIKLHNEAGKGKKERWLVLGRMLTLSQSDLFYNKALVFDSKHRLAEFFSSSNQGPTAYDALSSVIGQSAGMCAIKNEIRKISQTSSTVLISGESGTGKEVIARAIHAVSNRSDKPFIALNCGAIPDALLESELFGYVGGAFTGANASGRMGKFELADGGVLFLDEISALPLYLQVKLLRVLQERSFSRLGSNKTVSVDIRVIAASNENIPYLIAQKMFREDLYYRLNVIPLDMPALRERVEDIPLLSEFFLERYCRLFDKPKMTLPPKLLSYLTSYPWPGNVRELENCIEYMATMNAETLLDVNCLPAKIKETVKLTAAAANLPKMMESASLFAGDAITPLAELERMAIHHALKVFGTSSEAKRKAAEALGISTATLYRKLNVKGKDAILS